MAFLNLWFLGAPYVYGTLPIAALAFTFLWSRCARPNKKYVLQFGRLKWTLEDFCRGWLITGRTGSGKTASGIANLMCQVFQNIPNWGGLCVDQKGLFYEMLVSMAAAFRAQDRLVLLRVRPPDVPASQWNPRYTYNIIESDLMLASSIAEALIDSASARGVISKEGNGAHFVNQAKIHIGKAIDLLRAADRVPTLPKVYEILTRSDELRQIISEILEKVSGETDERKAEQMKEVVQHFLQTFLQTAQEELSGIKSSIANVLYFYCDPDIAQVFCNESPTFKMSMVDEGKIVCASIPQKFATERQFINTLLKMAFYKHALERFDRGKAYLRRCNPLIFWADEAQRVVTKSEQGMADYNVVDQTREAKTTIVLASQAERSFVPILGKDIKNTLVDNLGNELIFTVTNQEDAEEAAKRIGSRPIQKKSTSHSNKGSTRSYSEQVEAFIRPHELRSLRKHECVARHCEGRWHRIKLAPTAHTQPSTEAEREPGQTAQS